MSLPATAEDVSSTLFQSNMQSIAYVLALKRELASSAARHDEENEKRDAREACLHDIITDQQERIEQLKSAVALKELWARVLSFQQVGTYSLPAYDASTPHGENNQHNHDQCHAACALTFVSATVAKEMDAAVPGSAMALLLERVRAMSPALDGVMTTLSEENFQLRALLDDRSIAASLDKARVVKLREEAERARLEAEEMRAVAVEHGQLVQRQQAEMAALQRRIRQLEFNGECLQSELSDSKLSSPLDLAELEEAPRLCHDVHIGLTTPSTRPCIPTATPPNFSGIATPHASPIPVLSQSLTSSTKRHVQRQQYARGERDDPAQPAKQSHSHSHFHASGSGSGSSKALTTPDAAAAMSNSRRRGRSDPAVVSPPTVPAAAGPPNWPHIAASGADKENVDPRGKKPLASVRREKVHVVLSDDCFEDADVVEQVLSAMQIINGL